MATHVFDNSNLLPEIFAIDTCGAVIYSLGHGRKHMLTILPTIVCSLGFGRVIFLCLLVVFLKSKTHQLILKNVIKLNRNLR